MKSLTIWLHAIRPKTLIAAASPVAIGTCLAAKSASFDPSIFLYTLLSALGVQVGTNLANDYFDGIRGTDAFRVGPVRVTQSNLVSLRTMRLAISLCFIFTSLACIPLIIQGGMTIALLAALSIFLGICYTAGPFPIAYIGMGEVFAFLFFGPVATIATYFLQTKTFSYQAILAGMICGSFSCALLIMNNLRDHKQDEIAEKKTFVVRFGSIWGKKEYAASMLFPACISVIFFRSHPWTLATLLCLPATFSVIQACVQAHKATDYIPLLPRTSSIFALHSLLFCLGIML